MLFLLYLHVNVSHVIWITSSTQTNMLIEGVEKEKSNNVIGLPPSLKFTAGLNNVTSTCQMK